MTVEPTGVEPEEPEQASNQESLPEAAEQTEGGRRQERKTTFRHLIESQNPDLQARLMKDIGFTPDWLAKQMAPLAEASKHITEMAAGPTLQSITAAMSHNLRLQPSVNLAVDFINSEAFKATRSLNAAIQAMSTDLISQRSSALTAFSASLTDSNLFGPTGSLATISAQITRQTLGLDQFFKNMPRINWGIPCNLAELEDVWVREYAPVVIADGIPLYGVPRASIALAIIRAESSEVRWQLIETHSADIATDCHELLAEMETALFANELTLAQKAAAALTAGHPEAAQALCATILDCLEPAASEVAKEFTSKSLLPPHGPADPEAYADLPVRMNLAFGPLWRAFTRFDRKQPKTVPTRFGRHPTAHSVHPDQFTLPNAVQGVMVVASMLYLLVELEADDNYEFSESA